jgi:transcriptional regulator with XRE-family HTH domain
MSRVPRADYALAEAVLSLRQERGLSRNALAFRSGVTPGTVAGVELAQIAPRWDTVRLLARGLSTSLVDLSAEIEWRDVTGSEDRPVA